MSYDAEQEALYPVQCGKRRYECKKDAQTSINAAWHRPQRRGRPKTELRAYHCDRCNGWHLTKQTRFHGAPRRDARR